MIRFEDVTLRYGTSAPVLSELNFELEPGSFHFVLGASGAGKSTLLRLMHLAKKPSEGLVHIFGRDTSTLERVETARLRRRIGMVYQDFRLLDHLSAMDNVALPLRVSGQKIDKKIHTDISELLSWVGLGDHLDALPPTMSGGQQQRIAIARAVIGRPSLLLADEPTGNVDDRIALRLLYLFEELNKLGTTVVIATHNEALVNRFNHSILRLADARIEMVQLRRRPTRKPSPLDRI